MGQFSTYLLAPAWRPTATRSCSPPGAAQQLAPITTSWCASSPLLRADGASVGLAGEQLLVDPGAGGAGHQLVRASTRL